MREKGETLGTVAAAVGIRPGELQAHVFGLTLTVLSGGRSQPGTDYPVADR
jgi:hypothetical protein